MEKLEQFKDLLEYKEENSKTTVAVGMSGGVDSSAVAYLLKRQGYNVIGITMKHWSAMDDYAESDSKTCCSLDDIYDAKRVCDDLGIPHYVVNLEEQFKEVVVGYFVDEYSKGRTPRITSYNVCYTKLLRNTKAGGFLDSHFDFLLLEVSVAIVESSMKARK